MIVLGRLLAPYGVKGWLKLAAFGDDPQDWVQIAQIWLCADVARSDADWQAFHLVDLRRHGKGWLLRLGEVNERNAAENLSGWYLGVPREQLPALPVDELYWADLLGMKVIGGGNVCLGWVSEILESAAHPLLVVHSTVDSEGKAVKRLLPYVNAVVKAVDRASGVIEVDWRADWLETAG